MRVKQRTSCAPTTKLNISSKQKGNEVYALPQYIGITVLFLSKYRDTISLQHSTNRRREDSSKFLIYFTLQANRKKPNK